jgi:molybdenum cofactor guanylyltransferase
VTVAVLAGGKSARFGSDKALATLPGEARSFLERAVDVGAAIADEVIVVGPARAGFNRPGVRFIPDLFPGEGPAGGVITALADIITARLIVLACDQPLVRSSDLSALLEASSDRQATAFALSDGTLQPLPCVLDVATCLPIATAAFSAGTRSLKNLLLRCGVVPVGLEGAGSIVDIDTPGDYGAFAQAAASRTAGESNAG